MKQYRPTSPGRRQMTSVDFSILAYGPTQKNLVAGRAKRSARTRHAGITVRHRGGGVKQRYRFVDFRQLKRGVPGKVAAIEYDPNRSAFIALVVYADGEKLYLLAPQGLNVGDAVLTAEEAPLKPGHRLMLKNIPVGAFIHNIELAPGRGGQIARSAGSSAQVMAHDGGYAHVKLPSTEIRKIAESVYASVGMVSNPEHGAVSVGKAGRNRWRGIRPTVRGSAMNPVDHSHGGGEGRAPIGLKYPKTPWGKHALGVKTRKRSKRSNVFIVQRRTK